MEQKVSTIKKVELKKEDIHSMIMFDKLIRGEDLQFLEAEFNLSRGDIKGFVGDYRNAGIVFKLKPLQSELSSEWERFLSRTMKKGAEFDKFNNIVVNNKYDRVILITNKRLLKIDMQRLNEKIEETNYRIENYDERIEAEEKEFEKESTEEKKGFFNKLVEAWKK